MNNLVVVVCFILFGGISFHLGMNWAAYQIRNEIIEKGYVDLKWGESSKTEFRIVGNIKVD